MSFAVWKEKPPFTFEPEDREQVYPVGDMWVVTDDPARATPEEVDAVLNPKPDVNAENVAGSAVRARADKIDDLERQMASGELTQAEVNSRLIALLKEQVK